MMRKANRNWVWPVRVTVLTGLFVVIYLAIFYHSKIGVRTRIAPIPAVPKNTKPLPLTHSLDHQIEHFKAIAEWKPPEGMKVVGLVFYGRRRFVSILKCYLERNMAENGGLLDEIIFIAKTGDKDDLAYLDELLASNPKYSAQYHNRDGFDYSQMWSVCEKGNVYVKIDDDVLFIEDTTIRSIVKRKVESPRTIIVSANLVVQFAFAWIHYHLGAIHPYLPDLTPLPPDHPLPSWRKTALPFWDGPEDFNVTNFTAPEHHRWLPLAPGTGSTDKTPIAETKYMVGGSGWDDWRVGAQQHYSFLENLEKEELWRYQFDMWDVGYDRLSINLMAIMGDDVVDMMPMPRDDEELITEIYSKRTGRHVVVDGHGLAVHNGYWVMSARDGHVGIEATDILDRYRAYAEENICMVH